MLEFQDKRKLKRWAYSKPAIGVLFLLLLFLAHSTWGVYQKKLESEANLLRVSNELNALVKREGTLGADIGKLQTSQGVEAEIRNRFQVAKEGEHVALIVDKDKAGANNTSGETQKSWWDSFVGWFK